MEGPEITLKIAFCDDEPLAIEQLKNIVEQYILFKDIKAEIHDYLGGEELLQASSNTDILFLDIDMPVINGIVAGKAFRAKNPDCRIIMATGQNEIQKEIFEITPFQYVTKPFDKREIYRCLDQALDSIKRLIGNNKVTLYSNRSMRIVREQQILYYKAEFGYLSVKLCGENSYYRMTSSLSKIEKTMDPRMFAAISRQYIINLGYVTNIDSKKDAITLGTDTIQVSKKYKKSFYEKLQKYDLYYRR